MCESTTVLRKVYLEYRAGGFGDGTKPSKIGKSIRTLTFPNQFTLNHATGSNSVEIVKPLLEHVIIVALAQPYIESALWPRLNHQ